MNIPHIPFNIFPVGPDKAPLIAGWQAKATRDPNTVAQWQAHGAQAWGIPCGADNGLFVIDLDLDKATGEPIGEASLKATPRYAALLDRANVHTRPAYPEAQVEARNWGPDGLIMPDGLGTGLHRTLNRWRA